MSRRVAAAGVQVTASAVAAAAEISRAADPLRNVVVLMPGVPSTDSHSWAVVATPVPGQLAAIRCSKPVAKVMVGTYITSDRMGRRQVAVVGKEVHTVREIRRNDVLSRS